MGELVLGIDSSTQSVKALLVAAETGQVISQKKVPHPTGTEIDPELWWQALQAATAELLPRAAAVAVAGQQHGCVTLDAANRPVRPALLWHDTRSAKAAAQLVHEWGGPHACASAVGSVLVASFTASKLRWLRETEPDAAAATRTVLLPHDYLSWRLGGQQEFTTDAGDASGTGYFDPATRSWRPDLAQSALGHRVALPRVAGPSEIIGRTASGAVIAAGTGDNMAAALGLGLAPEEASLSIGTSGVAAMVQDQSSADPSGQVAGFSDATGRFLPLVCTLNAAKILDAMAELLGIDVTDLGKLALAARPSELTLLPYFAGERTPNRPQARGTLTGWGLSTDRRDLARAAVTGLLCSLRDAATRLGPVAGRILLIGGGAQNRAVQDLAPAVFCRDLYLPQPAEYVALGAARQAAWALSGAPHPPQWAPLPGKLLRGEPEPGVWQRYLQLRDVMEPG